MTALAVPEPQSVALPGLKLELFTDMAVLPDRYIVHAATSDRNAPMIRRGEVVVVDLGSPFVSGGWYPREGALFLIEYASPPSRCERYGRRSWEIVQTFTNSRGLWFAGSLRRGMQGREFFAQDGPYHDEMALADKLIGSVIGLYKPNAGGLN